MFYLSYLFKFLAAKFPRSTIFSLKIITVIQCVIDLQPIIKPSFEKMPLLYHFHVIYIASQMQLWILMSILLLYGLISLFFSKNLSIYWYWNKIVIMSVCSRNMRMTNPLLIAFKRIFCNHENTFSFRRYNDFDFYEYDKCVNCEKILRYIRGFDESIRGW